MNRPAPLTPFDRVEAARLRAGLSKRELSRKAGLPDGTLALARWDGRILTTEILQALAWALDLPLVELPGEAPPAAVMLPAAGGPQDPTTGGRTQRAQARLPTTNRRTPCVAVVAAGHCVRDLRAIDLASAIDGAVASYLDGLEIPASARAALVGEAVAIFLVQASDQIQAVGEGRQALALPAPSVARIEWLLTEINRRAWALQLARNFPAPPTNGGLRLPPTGRSCDPAVTRIVPDPVALPCDVEAQS